jgi:hypothetical protein
VPALAELCRRWQPSFVGMESVAFQRLLILEAAKHPGIPPVHELKPAGKGKLARAVGAIVKAERREIHLPERAGWLEDFETKLGAFVGVNDAHDDQVDCIAYAVGAVLLYAESAEDFEPVLGSAGYSDLYGWSGGGYDGRELYGGGGGFGGGVW